MKVMNLQTNNITKKKKKNKKKIILYLFLALIIYVTILDPSFLYRLRDAIK